MYIYKRIAEGLIWNYDWNETKQSNLFCKFIFENYEPSNFKYSKLIRFKPGHNPLLFLCPNTLKKKDKSEWINYWNKISKKIWLPIYWWPRPLTSHLIWNKQWLQTKLSGNLTRYTCTWCVPLPVVVTPVWEWSNQPRICALFMSLTVLPSSNSNGFALKHAGVGSTLGFVTRQILNSIVPLWLLSSWKYKNIIWCWNTESICHFVTKICLILTLTKLTLIPIFIEILTVI